MELQERNLAELSCLQVRFYLGASQRFDYLRIMAVRFSGVYKEGCTGNEDAVYMCVQEPLIDRRSILLDVLGKIKASELMFSEGIVEFGQAFFEQVVANGHEGMMAKHRSSRYLPGKRSAAWKKIKPTRTLPSGIIGYTAATMHKAAKKFRLHGPNPSSDQPVETRDNANARGHT